MRHGMEQFSINMFWLALAATAMATLLYWGHAFGVRLALRRLATNGQSLNVASWERLPASIGQAATLVGWLVVVFLAVALVARWRATGHAPWSNMWEYTVAFAGGTALAYAAFERWYGQRTLGAFVQPVVLGLLATAAAMRLWDLGSRAIHHDESLHAFYSWNLYRGEGYEHIPMMHGPFQFEANAAIFFAFGDSDYTARLLYALMGTVLVLLPFFFRGRLGRLRALLVATMLAFSPAMLYFSRFARNDIYVGLWTLGLVICLWRYIKDGHHRYLYIAAGLLALSFATKEATFLNVAIFIAFLDLWIAQTLANQIRERHNLDPLAAPFLFLALAPFAWAIVAVWPFLSEDRRQRIGLGERPRAADFLLILGTLTLPQFAAAVQVPLEALGMKEANWSRHLFTLNLGPLSGIEEVTREEPTGFLTVSVLVASTAFIGLRWNWRSWLIVGVIFYNIFGLL